MAELEFRIIEQFFRHPDLSFSNQGLDLGIGDDCALLSVAEGEQLAVSMDLLQPDIHFPASAIPGLIARRALAVNLSDLAAAGADPVCFTLGLAIPEADLAWLEAFSQGLARSARRYNCPLAGGDLIRGSLQIAIQVHGRVPTGRALLRSGAAIGDQIYVTGTLGDGAAGLALVKAYEQGGRIDRNQSVLATERPPVTDRDYLINAFYGPEPRLAAGMALRGLASAAIDISDGLLADLDHIAHDSQVGARIELDALPFSSALNVCIRPECRRELALFGGDDYELCVTLPAQACAEAEQALAELELPFTRIGEITAGAGVTCADGQGEEVVLENRGYTHFGREES